MSDWDEYAVLEAELGSRAAAELLAENSQMQELALATVKKRLYDAAPKAIVKAEPSLEGAMFGIDGDDEQGKTYELLKWKDSGTVVAELIWPEGTPESEVDWLIPVNRIQWLWPDEKQDGMWTPEDVAKFLANGGA